MKSALPVLLLAVSLCPLFSQEPIPPVIPPGFVLVDDMILPEEVVYGESAWEANAWIGGIVPYAFDANVNAANRAAAVNAMAEISGAGFVTYVPRTNQPDWIVITASTANNSWVGRQGGAQILNIVSWGFRFVIVHELMHALGYIHEQQRPDRDSFVAINWNNIQGGQAPNFQIHQGAIMPTAYDFLSIMHYDRCAFSVGCPPGSSCNCAAETITCLPPNTGFQNQIGNRTFLSLGDAAGLVARYGFPSIPGITTISPAAVSTNSGTFTLDVYGTTFYQGSPNGSGVQGTRIQWNGADLPTTYVDPNHVQATITPAMISQPGTVTIRVNNPSPAAGTGFTTATLTISCPPGASTNLTPGVPQTVTASCTGWNIAPAANAWSVVGISSATANWDLSAANVNSNLGGTSTDYLGNSGVWGGVTPAAGGFQLSSGSGGATAEYVASHPLAVAVPKVAEISPGHILQAYHFTPFAVGSYLISTSGSPNLVWALLWQGNNASVQWQSPTTAVASGQIGGPAATNLFLAPGSYCIVVSRAQIGTNGGPAPAPEPFTLNVCFNASITSVPYNIPMVTLSGANQGFCFPFTFNPIGGKWNAVGVSSTSDWDVAIGSAESQLGGIFFGSPCDYVIANGHAGTIAPTYGVFSRYSGTADGNGLHGHVQTVSVSSGGASEYVYMLSLVEFEVTNPGNYTFGVNSGIPGGGPYSWDLHRPGTGSGWRTRASALSWGAAADGSPQTFNLAAGWHAVVICRSGGADWANGYPLGVNAAVSITQAANPAPVLTSVSPGSMLAGSANFQLDVFGSGFSSSSVVRWNGAALPTGLVSATQLYASVSDTLVASIGSAAVTVSTPAPGGGISGAISFAITGNPVPGPITVTPYYAVVGSLTTGVTVNGTAFVPGATAHWDGAPLPTSFISSTQLSVSLAPGLLQVYGNFQITVLNPAPGGGSSPAFPFHVGVPVVSYLAPAAIPILTPASAPVTIDVWGNFFLPSSVVVADGTVLATTYVDAFHLRCQAGPSLPQSRRPGGICVNVQNTIQGYSTSAVLVVGSGSNQGRLYRHPLMPQPGEAHALRLEFGRPGAVYSIFADIGNPPPLTAWPTPSADMVLAVGPLVTAGGLLLPLVDGLGIVGPASGATLNTGGHATIPGFVMPNPLLNIDLTVQGIYLDPTSPVGFRLTWARDHAGI